MNFRFLPSRHRPTRGGFPGSGLGLVAAAAAAAVLSGCAARTTVLVRDADDTAYAGRALGGYRYPVAQTLDGKESVLASSGSPRRLATGGDKVSDVRTADVVTEQAVGGYVDPGDARLYHHPHIVSRLDERARWRLAPAADTDVLHGPVSGLRRKEYAPTATAGEVGREVMETRRTNERMLEVANRVESQQATMAGRATENEQLLLKNQDALLRTNNGLKTRLDQLETRQMQAQRQPSGSTGIPLTTPNGGGTPGADGRVTPAPMTQPQTVNREPDHGAAKPSGMYDGSER